MNIATTTDDISSVTPSCKSCSSNRILSKAEGNLTAKTTLFHKCCLFVADQLMDHLFPWSLKAEIIKCLPNELAAEIIWIHMRGHQRNSLSMYLSFRKHFFMENCSYEQFGMEYITLTHEGGPINLGDTILVLKTVNQTREYFKFLTVLSISTIGCDLTQLTNFPFLIALEIHSISSKEISRLIELWKNALKMDSSRWNRLQLISVRELDSPKGLYDLFQFIPSILCIYASISSTVIANVPVIKENIGYDHDFTKAFNNTCLLEKLHLTRDKFKSKDHQDNDTLILNINLSTTAKPVIRTSIYHPQKNCNVYYRNKRPDGTTNMMHPTKGRTHNKKVQKRKRNIPKNINRISFFGL
ncbi:uncharacterized protein NDAI_0K00260 [Naumovozyma dairenensis CBS 421]|uniref:Uncharacterized protein n=1 Tax=Naumovozyma dairenensis (strain ATCC 10597 / BCRC 20456 / CBS 421 / NBRC 0211 / NRRL Y-12639) TaxID=1071378 RepID=G0WHF4_NAUDC|nr:hypothetical protein NDAI_0K00260 [Naumovozyma dairenensis CBS 421]CCD27215.1 hypothetical protein NDAI_0K00260 [Naumovozyma dairenensis CBS 421]